ncbi:MAG: hypothetical protein Q9222_004279, partial [Ikaeria aurantiellina]
MSDSSKTAGGIIQKKACATSQASRSGHDVRQHAKQAVPGKYIGAIFRRRGHQASKLGKQQNTERSFDSVEKPVIITTYKMIGYGIDFAKASHCVLYQSPDTVEDYISAVGRVGRIGRLAKAVILFDDQDPRDNNLQEMIQMFSRLERVPPRDSRIIVRGEGILGAEL